MIWIIEILLKCLINKKKTNNFGIIFILFYTVLFKLKKNIYIYIYENDQIVYIKEK